MIKLVFVSGAIAVFIAKINQYWESERNERLYELQQQVIKYQKVANYFKLQAQQYQNQNIEYLKMSVENEILANEYQIRVLELSIKMFNNKAYYQNEAQRIKKLIKTLKAEKASIGK